MSKNSKESGKNTKKIRVVSKRDLSNQQQTIGIRLAYWSLLKINT